MQSSGPSLCRPGLSKHEQIWHSTRSKMKSKCNQTTLLRRLQGGVFSLPPSCSERAYRHTRNLKLAFFGKSWPCAALGSLILNMTTVGQRTKIWSESNTPPASNCKPQSTQVRPGTSTSPNHQLEPTGKAPSKQPYANEFEIS